MPITDSGNDSIVYIGYTTSMNYTEIDSVVKDYRSIDAVEN